MKFNEHNSHTTVSSSQKHHSFQDFFICKLNIYVWADILLNKIKNK